MRWITVINGRLCFREPLIHSVYYAGGIFFRPAASFLAGQKNPPVIAITSLNQWFLSSTTSVLSSGFMSLKEFPFFVAFASGFFALVFRITLRWIMLNLYYTLWYLKVNGGTEMSRADRRSMKRPGMKVWMNGEEESTFFFSRHGGFACKIHIASISM